MRNYQISKNLKKIQIKNKFKIAKINRYKIQKENWENIKKKKIHLNLKMKYKTKEERPNI